MKNIWLAIISDVDDGQLFVNGVFDNERAARKCIEDDFLAANSLIYKVELADVKSTYTPHLDDN